MTEERITKTILKWLKEADWDIVCFDFPQSGTGRLLHPNSNASAKNKGSINPDIVAVKNNICVFFENKDRFYYPDYEKVNMLRTTDDYSDDISALLAKHKIDKIFYGIGLPKGKHKKKSIESTGLVDFIVGVEESGKIEILYSCIDGVF